MAVERARPDPRLLLGTPGIGIALTMLFVGGGATSHLVVLACWIVGGVARGSRGRPAGAWRAHRGRRTRGRAGLGLSEPKVVCATGSPAGRRALRSVAGGQDYRFNTQPSLGGSPPDRRRSHLVDFIR